MKIIISLIVAISILPNLGCKHNKKAEKSEVNEGLKNDFVIAVPTPSEQEKVAANQPAEVKSAQQPTKIKEPDYPDSLLFRMERTPCFGACPVYRVNIYKGGFATLEGRKFFDYIGTFKGRFPEPELTQLEEIAMASGYFDFAHVYDANVTDLPSCTTVLNTAAGKNWVYNRMNSPDQLKLFEQQAEELIKRCNWQEMKPIKDNMD